MSMSSPSAEASYSFAPENTRAGAASAGRRLGVCLRLCREQGASSPACSATCTQAGLEAGPLWTTRAPHAPLLGGNRARSAGHADPAQPASKNAGRRRCRLVRVGCRDPDPAARRRLARAGRRSDALLETSSGAARRAVARGVTCRLWRYASKSEGSPPCPVFAAHDWPSRPDRLAGDKTRSRRGRLAPRLTAARLEHRSRLRALLGESRRFSLLHGSLLME